MQPRDAAPEPAELVESKSFAKHRYTVTDTKGDTLEPKDEGVRVYVIDTGYEQKYSPIPEKQVVALHDHLPSDEDPELHGTAVAALLYKNAVSITMVPLRHNTSTSGEPGVASRVVLEDLIKCFDDIAEDYMAIQQAGAGTRPIMAVINCSFHLTGAGILHYYQGEDGEKKAIDFMTALKQAIDRVLDLGIIVVAAAGNQNVQACHDRYEDWEKAKSKDWILPSILPMFDGIITVGALSRSLIRWRQNTSFSCYGPRVQYWALGDDIANPLVKSADDDKAKFPLLSATSNAAPMVSGIIACLLSVERISTHLAQAQVPANQRHSLIRNILDQLSKACKVEGFPGHAFKEPRIELKNVKLPHIQ